MKKVFIIILTVLAAASCRTGDLFERNAYSLETSTRMAGEIVAGAPGYFGHIKSDKVTNVGQGVSLLDLNCLNMNGYSVRMLLYKVSLGSATLDVALPSGENKSGLTSVLAGGLDAQVRVLGAVNGDAADKNKSAEGIIYRKGTAVKAAFSEGSKDNIFAILKEGTAVIADQSRYAAIRPSLYTAIGTRDIILRDGFVAEDATPKEEARTFVAVSQDGMTVWLGVVDGVYFYYSNGISCSDLATVLKAAGAWNAALLNSGNVTTLVKRDEAGEVRFPVVNTPANKGFEQASVNALAIIEN